MRYLTGLLVLSFKFFPFLAHANSDTARPVLTSTSFPSRPVAKETPPPQREEKSGGLRLAMPALGLLGALQLAPHLAAADVPSTTRTTSADVGVDLKLTF